MKLLKFFLVFCLFSKELLGSSSECLFDKGGPFPDADDPYQVSHTMVSPTLTKKLTLYKEPSYEFPEDESRLTICGDYRIDEAARLGYGEEGTVYLGKHLPTGIFVAAKKKGMTEEETITTPEFSRLQKLGRAYSLWTKPQDNVYFIVMPLVDGKEISYYQYDKSSPWITTTCAGTALRFSDVDEGLWAIRSFISEITYLARKGISHPDVATSSNIMVTNQHPRQVVLVDFGRDYNNREDRNFPVIHPENIQCSPYYTYYCHFLLGTQEFIKSINDGSIQEPKFVIDFFQSICRPITDPKRTPVSLSRFTIEYVKMENKLLQEVVFSELSALAVFSSAPDPDQLYHLIFSYYYAGRNNDGTMANLSSLS